MGNLRKFITSFVLSLALHFLIFAIFSINFNTKSVPIKQDHFMQVSVLDTKKNTG